MKKILTLILALIMVVTMTGCDLALDVLDILMDTTIVSEEEQTATLAPTLPNPAPASTQPIPTSPAVEQTPTLDRDGSYTTKEDVALYIHLYGCLPENFITKSEARKLGWEGGAVEPYAPGKCIGGDRFGNYEGLLPDANGRTWTECDIDTLGGGGRGAKRIVFSNDGLIYYTDDHYESFELLYGEP